MGFVVCLLVFLSVFATLLIGSLTVLQPSPLSCVKGRNWMLRKLNLKDGWHIICQTLWQYQKWYRLFGTHWDYLGTVTITTTYPSVFSGPYVSFHFLQLMSHLWKCGTSVHGEFWAPLFGMNIERIQLMSSVVYLIILFTATIARDHEFPIPVSNFYEAQCFHSELLSLVLRAYNWKSSTVSIQSPTMIHSASGLFWFFSFCFYHNFLF